MKTNVVHLTLTKKRALEIAREVSENSTRMVITNHARTRMRQRGLTTAQILRCLAYGLITEGPVFDQMKGAWNYRMEHFSAGERYAIACGIEKQFDLKNVPIIIITVIDLT